jgi:uncharacterized protein (DUF433 family)
MTRPQARRYLSARVAAPILDDLDRRARRVRKPRSNLVEQYIAEGLKLDEHPGITFVDTVSGRKAALAAFRGLTIWEIVETFLVNDRSIMTTAQYLSLPESQVHAAIRYYAANRDEIDAEIRANEEAADEHEAAWRREQAALR